MSITQFPETGARRHVRALATSQGWHWQGIRAALDGAESMTFAADHDAHSDGHHQRADSALSLAIDSDDIGEMRNLIRVSLIHRSEAYRYDRLEDERITETLSNLTEAHDANLAGSQTCDEVLRQKPACKHGRAA